MKRALDTLFLEYLPVACGAVCMVGTVAAFVAAY